MQVLIGQTFICLDGQKIRSRHYSNASIGFVHDVAGIIDRALSIEWVDWKLICLVDKVALMLAGEKV